MNNNKVADILSDEQKDILNKIHDEVASNTLNERKPKRETTHRFKNPDTVEDAFKHYPIHVVKLVNLVKSNSDIRRYTALGILNYLYQKNIIDQPKGYVTFNWSKFRITNKGLSTEYRYSESFFLNCLVASFTSFANAAQKIINTFCSEEFTDSFVQDDKIITEAVNAAERADEESGDESKS